MSTGVMLVAPISGLLAYHYRSRRWEVGLGSLALLVLFLLVMTFLDRPDVLFDVLMAAPMSLAVSAPRRLRPPAWLLTRAMLIAVPFLTLYSPPGFSLARVFRDDSGRGRDPRGRWASS